MAHAEEDVLSSLFVRTRLKKLRENEVLSELYSVLPDILTGSTPTANDRPEETWDMHKGRWLISSTKRCLERIFR